MNKLRKILSKLPIRMVEVGVICVFAMPFIMSFILENFAELIPCILCVIERWMHFGIFFAYVIFSYNHGVRYRPMLFLIGINLLLTFYHLGVEAHIFAQDCDTLGVNNISADCSIPKYFLGVKMTIWNLVYSCFEIFTLYFVYPVKKSQRDSRRWQLGYHAE